MGLWQAHQFSEMDWHDLGWQEALTARERKSKLIFLLHKLTTERIQSLSGLFLFLLKTILLCVTYNLAFWLMDSENRMWERRGVTQPLQKGLTGKSYFPKFGFAETWQLRTGVVRGGWDHSPLLHGSTDPVGVIFFKYLTQLSLFSCTWISLIPGVSPFSEAESSSTSTDGKTPIRPLNSPSQKPSSSWFSLFKIRIIAPSGKDNSSSVWPS